MSARKSRPSASRAQEFEDEPRIMTRSRSRSASRSRTSNKTPQMTPLSKELRKVIHQNSLLTAKTKSKFLKDLDRHIEDKNTQYNDKRRAKIIEEIISSEETYLHQLEILIKYFMTPLKDVDYVSATECNTLFYNIESLERISKELLSQLNSDDNIGSAFINLTPYFKVYSLYAYNYNSVLKTLQNISESNKKLSAFINKQESRPEVNSKITALLITPIQRIPRYRLLLKEVLTFTSKDHPHYETIKKALKDVTSTTDQINKLVLEQQHMTRLVELQRNLAGGKPTIVTPGRQLIREGHLMKMSTKGNNSKASACYLVLLSDMIMYCKEWKANEKLKCEKVLPISKCKISKMVFKQGLFNVTCQDLSYIFYSTTTNEEGNAWFNAIKFAIEEHQAKFQTLKKRASSRKALKRKDLDQLDENINIKQRRKRKAEKEDGDTSSDCGTWKVLKLSESARGSSSKDNAKKNGDSKEDASKSVVSTGATNEQGRSFTHTIYYQARTVVSILGESMKRYLLPSSYFTKKEPDNK